MTLYRVMVRSVTFPMYEFEADPGLSDDEVIDKMDHLFFENVEPVDYASGGDLEVVNIDTLPAEEEPEEPEDFPADRAYAKAFPSGVEDYA